MAEYLKEKFELLALRVSLRAVGPEAFAQLELESNEGGVPKVLKTWRVSTDDLGLPRQLDARHMPEFRLPKDVVHALVTRVKKFGRPAEHPLWLHLVKPYGYLGIVEWEKLLVPALERPLLRLPDFLERPRENRGVLNVALCATAPVASPALPLPDLLRAITEAILTRPARPLTRVHVFADAANYAELQQSFAGNEAVAVHDPKLAEVYGKQERSKGIPTVARSIHSPWLLWMRDAMQGQSLDAVHFVCHGFLAGDRPALSLTESPLLNADLRDARYIGVAELAMFLTQTGAWSAIFADPPENYSEVGLRLLADTLAQARPGPVLYYPLGSDRGMDPEAAFRFLFAREPGTPPTAPEMFAYCQPELIDTQLDVKKRNAPQVIDINAGFFEEPVEHTGAFAVLPGTAPQINVPQINVPQWIAAAQRHVETVSLDLQRRRATSSEAGSGAAPSIDAATETLEELQRIVADYASGQGLGSDTLGGFKIDIRAGQLKPDMRTLAEEQ